MGETVLVLRALGLGDGLTGVPALRGLRRLLGPDARIVLAAPAGIGTFLAAAGLADELLETPALDDVAERWRAARPGRAPDLAVDLHGRGPRSHRLLQSLRPGRLLAWRCPEAGHLDGPEHDDAEHEVTRWCRLVGWAGGPCGPDDLRLVPPATAATPPGPLAPALPDRAGTLGDGDGESGGDGSGSDGGDGDDRLPTVRPGAVVVHPGAASPSRRWPVERFAAVARTLSGRGHQVVVTGSASEAVLTARVAAAAPDAVDLAGRLDLRQLAAVVAAGRLVLCGDTGTAHLATAFGTDSVLLFGPTPPARWGPAIDRGRHRVLWHGPELAPPGTVYLGDPHGEDVDPALERTTVAEVTAAVDELLV